MIREFEPAQRPRHAREYRRTDAGGPGHRLLALQRTAGNAAVQRAIEHATYDRADANRMKAAKEFFANVDAATKNARDFVFSVPTLGACVALDGRTALWHKLWTDYMADRSTQGLPAAFGYVIETLVSNPLSPYYAKAPDGYTILPQVTRGGTRPDLVLVKGGEHVAWVDITASNSRGHIFQKDSWDRYISIYAEVTYDSLVSAQMLDMRANNANTGELSADELKAKMAEAEARYKKLRAYWDTIGTSLQYKQLEKEMFDKIKIKIREYLQLVPHVKQNFIKERLKETFAVTMDDSTAVNVLTALNVNPVGWGFMASQSFGAGEAWLMENAVEPKEADD